MTSPTQGEHAQPEALRLALILDEHYLRIGRIDATNAAAELRRLHAQVAASASPVAQAGALCLHCGATEGAHYMGRCGSVMGATRYTPAKTTAQTESATEWDVRGHLAASLTCWHRLTEKEAAELVALFQGRAAPATVLHLVHNAFADLAMAFPKAYALNKVQIADTAVRGALAAPAAGAVAGPDEADTVDLVGVRDNGEHVNLGKIAMPPRMKAREIAASQFGGFQDEDGSDAEMCFGAMEELLAWMTKQGWAAIPAVIPAAAPTPAAQASQMEAIAEVVEELGSDGNGWFAKVRWLYNPVPVGEQLYWPQPAAQADSGGNACPECDRKIVDGVVKCPRGRSCAVGQMPNPLHGADSGVQEDAALLWDAFVDAWRIELDGADQIVNIIGSVKRLKPVFLRAALAAKGGKDA